jgi:hypothetical protein
LSVENRSDVFVIGSNNVFELHSYHEQFVRFSYLQVGLVSSIAVILVNVGLQMS